MPPTTQARPSTFRVDMLGRNQRRQLEQTGTFRDRRGRQRDAQGRVAMASQTPQNAPGATNTTQPAPTTTRTPYDALRAFSVANAPTPIESPVPADMVQPAAELDLPSPQAPAVQEQFITSLSDQVANTRATFETTLQSRRDEIAAEQTRLEQERDSILENGVAQNMEPFRERLERTERQRLSINENFEANQRLTNELDTLLTEGNNLIRYQQGLPVSQRVVDARVNNAMRDVAARAGVIEAVMSARNSQITQAYTMIDRTVAAITADRNDQLSYYGALLNVKEQGLLKLSKEDETLANEQLSLAKRDMEQAQATADYIKTLMIDPETAQFVADAGVTMLDSVESINQKMSAQTGRRQLEATKNQYVQAGYEYVPFPTDDMEGLTTVEVNGQQLSFRVRPGSQLALDMEATRASTSGTYLVNRLRQLEIATTEQKIAAANAASASGALRPEQADAVSELSKQLLAEPSYKEMFEIRAGYNTAKVGFEQQSGFGDIAMVNGYQRMIDPGATVRGEDIRTQQEAVAFIQSVLNYRGQVLRGDKFTPEVRTLLDNAIDAQYERRVDDFNTNTRARFENRINSNSIIRDVVTFADIGDDFSVTGTPPATQPVEPESLPIGGTFIMGGVIYQKQGEDSYVPIQSSNQ